jgi:hypothetical protein
VHNSKGQVTGFLVVGHIPVAGGSDSMFVETFDLAGKPVESRTITMNDLVAMGFQDSPNASLCPLDLPNIQTGSANAFDAVEIGDGGDFAIAGQVNVASIYNPVKGCTNMRLDHYSYVDMTSVLLRLSPSLAPVWAKRIGRFSGVDFDTPMAMVKDGFVVVGNDAATLTPTSTSTTVVTARAIKTNFAGEVVWTGDYLIPGDQNDCSFGVGTTADGGILIAGNNDRNEEDYFILKIQPDCVTPPADLVAWYPLDEFSANQCLGSACDHSAYGKRAKWWNGPTPVPGVVASGLQFDGVNDYIEAGPSGPNAIGTKDFTIDGWIRVNPGDAGGIRSIVDKRVHVGTTYRGYHVALIQGTLWLQLATGSYGNFSSAANIADGQWHFFAVTVERKNQAGIRWYIDGVQTSVRNPGAHTATLTNSSHLRFGRRTVDSPGQFKGALDELEIFTRALSAGEVVNIFSAGAAGKCK